MSTASGLILAIFGVDLVKQNRTMGKVPGLLLSDVAIIIGIGLGLMLVLALGILFWLKLIRKRRRHVHGGEKVYRGSPSGSPEEEEEEDDEPTGAAEETASDDQHEHHHPSGRRRYKYRVRRRSHRTRNPTLAETGGLPPAKTHDPS